MSRLEKKCFVASAGAHAFLFVALFAMPLVWASKRHEVTVPVITFLPAFLVDGASGGGGSPNAKGMPPLASAPPAAVTLPEPTPPSPPPPKPETTKSETKPAKPEPESVPKARKKTGEPVPTEKRVEKSNTEDTDESSNSKTGKRKVQVSLNRVARPEKSAGELRAQAQANARAAQAQYAARVNNVLGAIGAGISTGTSLEVPGPGGEAYADYGQFVELAYKRAWTPPPDLADDRSTVKVKVVILRDGTVESFKILKNSGHADLDKTVERLRSITFIARFPDGALDQRRAFIINFNLEAQ